MFAFKMLDWLTDRAFNLTLEEEKAVLKASNETAMGIKY